MYKLLKHKSEGIKENVVGFTSRLIEISSPSLNEEELAYNVEEQMKKLGYDDVIKDGAGNVLGILRGRSSGPTLLLNAHMDTVEADEKEWTHSPLQPRYENGYIYGLGASDCKSGLAAICYAGHLLKRALLPLKGNLVVAATVAEENGRSIGVNTLLGETLPELSLEPDYAILAEPTELGLYYGHDGWAEFEIRIEGKDPFQVQDAADNICGELRSEMDRIDSEIEELSIGQPYFHEKDGIKEARIKMNQRLAQSEKLERCLHRLQKEAANAGQFGGSVAVDVEVSEGEQKLYTGRKMRVRNVTYAWDTDPFNPLMERARHALSAAGTEVKTGRWTLDRLRMGTAGSVLVNKYNIPTIGYGPGSEKAAHSPDEWVQTENISEAVYGLASISHGLVGVPVFGWTSEDL